MADKFVIWVDDEPNLVNGEIFDLENRGYHTRPFYSAGEALDWITENGSEVCKASAVIVDVLMPSRGDARFESLIGEPVGLLLCKSLQKSFPHWQAIQPWLTLYSRSPNTPNLNLAREFATSNQLFLARKSAITRIALELLRERRIRE
jgi:hypothetical protein